MGYERLSKSESRPETLLNRGTFVDFIGPGGETINPESIRARLSIEAQQRIDAIIRAESGTYDLEQIRQIGCGND